MRRFLRIPSLAKTSMIRTAGYYQKPRSDLLTPLADDYSFKNLWASKATPPPEYSAVSLNTAFLFEKSILKSLKRTRNYQFSGDLKVINEMILNSVIIKLFDPNSRNMINL